MEVKKTSTADPTRSLATRPAWRFALLLGALLLSLASGALADEPVDYGKQLKPLLRQRCYSCHGAIKQEAELRLDTVAQMLAGGDSGAALEPGDAEHSLIVQRVSATDIDERMPPEHEGEPLDDEQLAMLRSWIDAGAEGPADEQPEADPLKHWAFQPIARPPLPTIAPGAWSEHPIDRLLAEKHQQLGLTPQSEAPRVLLLRRLYLDLLGVPPTAAEIAAVLSDESPVWYDNVVDRLLEDPRHGERWARHWMDVWRYSDWWGLGAQLRNSQPHIWHWRDWIVESLNDDTPYDEMIRQMLAADELYPNDIGKLRATGYLARNWFLFNRQPWMEETVEHVSKGFLALTMNCAKCHDHKFDAIRQVDFYRMRAFFEPYHVRIDLVPGEIDVARDGIPRAFDGLLDVPTYRFVRGDEKYPDTSVVIEPGVPDLLAFDELNIEPVSLPREAWQPGEREWVLEAYLAAARSTNETAQNQVQQAKEKVAGAEAQAAKLAALADAEPAAAEPTDEAPVIADDFTTLDEQRWRLFGGQWVHEPGQLEQKQDGATQAALRLLEKPPRDFDATVRFQIQGGSRWRSVGLSFDAVQADPSLPTMDGESEQNVYVSAVAGGSKIQAAFRQGRQWTYPGGDAVRAMPIELGHVYTLRLQVRDTLVNASLDGQPLIAWRSPQARREGALQITTFDALAIVHEVSLAPLGADVELREPATPAENGPPATLAAAKIAVNVAQLELAVAQAAAEVAQAELVSIEQRAAAVLARSDSSEEKRLEAFAAAIRGERELAVAKAKQKLAEAQLGVARSAADQVEAAEQAVKQAEDALQQSIATIETPIPSDAQLTPLVGAKWTPTRFLNSGADDPTIEFPQTSTGRRSALADWITDRRNPLTARVAANHIWTRHMGRPLVPTMFDFGRNGIAPVHPELLDWLAAELMENGWSMKHLHRVIVTSSAYRMSSSIAGGEGNSAIDPDNQYWWRRVPQRLESQVIRDSLLAMAGTLDPTRGGPPVPSGEQANSKRRSLYFFHSNNERNLFLTTFDEALVKDCYRREQSIVPQQALALTHSALVLETAGQIAGRLSELDDGETEFIRRAFATLLGIEASDMELAAASRALAAWRELPQSTEDAARAHLVWVLINHNDFVTLR